MNLNFATNDLQEDQVRELAYWRTLAIYLADCHAATAEYDGSLKSVSKARRIRYASICETAHKALHGSFNSIHSGRVLEEAATRCAEAAKKLRLCEQGDAI